MTNLDELINIANRISQRLEIAAAEEKKLCVDICMAGKNVLGNFQNCQ